jgi:UDP:flavonoid glycosyltransferase YjiC (YdhE family)
LEYDDMKIIIAANQLLGHLNPLLAIGRILIEEGHEVVGVCGSTMRARIEKIGARFVPFPEGADQDLSNRAALYPELAKMPPGFDKARYSIERHFVDTLPAQHAGLASVLSWFPADVIIAENLLMGVLPMLLGDPSQRPPIITCGTTYLLWRRQDGAPVLGGFAPAETKADRIGYGLISVRCEEALMEPTRRAVDARLREIGVRPLDANIFDSLTNLPDAYLQLTTPSFEFPREDLPETVHFVGPLPIVPNQAPIPSWAHELDGSRKVVLVTQGSVANYDFTELVRPTMEALADEEDVLVIVTCGGRPTEAIPGLIPANARLADYLPFEWLLPKVDVFVTNGGYGSVNQALSHGIPLVTAGLTEDKADVNARVSWSGVGIDLQTHRPSPTALREAVRAVLDAPIYRSRATEIAREMQGIDTRARLLEIIAEVTAPAMAGEHQQAA